MCSHRVDQLAAEIVNAQRFQLVRDLVRQRRLHKRERPACVINDISIRHAGVRVADSVTGGTVETWRIGNEKRPLETGFVDGRKQETDNPFR